jgi:hypothetical protein
VIRLQDGKTRKRGLIWSKEKIFSLFQSAYTGAGNHPTSNFMGIGNFPWRLKRLGRKTDQASPLGTSLRVGRSIIHSPHPTFTLRQCTGTISLLTLKKISNDTDENFVYYIVEISEKIWRVNKF